MKLDVRTVRTWTWLTYFVLRNIRIIMCLLYEDYYGLTTALYLI